MVNPIDVDEIVSAIITLRDDRKKREQLAAGSIRMASALTIDQRAATIIKFIEKNIE